MIDGRTEAVNNARQHFFILINRYLCMDNSKHVNEVNGKPANPHLHVSHLYPPKKTLGQKASDKMTKWVGSWTFIISLLVVMLVWVAINTIQFLFAPFDPYPYILMNLFLSTLAAIQAPIILMSQNRSAELDRIKAERDFAVNRKAERENIDIQKDLEIIKKKIDKIAAKMGK